MENFTDHQLHLYATLVGMRPGLMGVQQLANVQSKVADIFKDELGIELSHDEQGDVLHQILVDYDMIKVEFTPVAPVRAKSGHEVL
tara:strand:+ start:335 stop:592 length:258 start_codon:yes stop_codon:yes gene_type:complete